MNLRLRKAGIRDLPAFLSLEKEASGTKLYSSIFAKRRWMNVFQWIHALNRSKVYFIELDDQLVGKVAYERDGYDHGYIKGLVVRHQFQHRGIGREAMQMILDKLEAVKKIELVTHPKNIPAIKLYESLGFHIESEIENYFGDGEPRVRMVLEK